MDVKPDHNSAGWAIAFIAWLLWNTIGRVKALESTVVKMVEEMETLREAIRKNIKGAGKE